MDRQQRQRPLSAKLTRPRTHAPLLRERVFREIDSALQRGTVAWIDGPPGSGKTTAVATWLEARARPFGWYHVDRADEDPAAVFFHLAEQARVLGGRRGLRLPVPTPEHLSDLAGFTLRFFRRLATALPDECILVFDNLHEVTAGGVVDVLREGVGELPVGMGVIAISRQPAPPALTKMVAGGQVQRVGWETLRLREEESRELALLHAAQCADARSMHERSGGWAAGLVLLAQRARDESAASMTAPGPGVFDYFAGEILDRAAPAHRDVMLCTALLPEISRDAAIALTGRVDAPEVLEDLHRRQYFTDRRAGSTPTWRYHDLFREFLQARLAQSTDPKTLARLRRQAGALLADTGAPGDAVVLYRQAGDWEAIGALIRLHAAALMAAGRWQTLAGWFEGLPESARRADPWVLFWWAACRVMTDPKDAQTLLTEAFDAFAAAGDTNGQFHAALAQAEVVFVLGETFRPLDRWIDALAPLLAGGRAFETVADGMRAWSAFVNACIYRRPEHPLMPEGVRYLDTHLRSPDIDDSQRTGVATVLLGAGHFAADEAMLHRVLPLTERLVQMESIAPVTRTWAAIWIVVVKYMWADFPGTATWTAWTRELAERHGLTIMVRVADVYRSYGLYQTGHVAEALKIDAELLAEDDALKVYTLAYALALSGAHQLHEGNTAAGDALFVRAIDAARITGFLCTEAVWQVQRACGLADQGRVAEAVATMASARAVVGGPQFTAFQALYSATDAWCALASGDRDAAVAHLRLALDASHPSKKIAKLCWIRHRLPELFSLALGENIAPDLVKRLIREWRIPPASSVDPRWPWPVRIRVLGGFEVLLDDVPLHHRRKAPRRLLQLLKTIAAFGARDVAMSRLADAMFPQDDGGKGEDGLRVALQRLRDLLRAEGHVLLRDGKVSLSPQSVWVDAVAFDAGLRRATSPAEIDAALALYAGPLLEGEDDPNYLEPRERLQNRFLRQAVERAEAHVAAGQCETALALYRRCADADVLNESFCQGVLRCCAALGRVAEGETAYRRLETALRDAFGRSPSEPTRRVFAALEDRRTPDR